MPTSINLSFEEILKSIINLKPAEKQEIAKILIEETDISENLWQEAIRRKRDFEVGKISTENWETLKKRILS